MKLSTLGTCAIACAVVIPASSAMAAIVTTTVSGMTGSGYLGGVAFSNQSYTMNVSFDDGVYSLFQGYKSYTSITSANLQLGSQPAITITNMGMVRNYLSGVTYGSTGGSLVLDLSFPTTWTDGQAFSAVPSSAYTSQFAMSTSSGNLWMLNANVTSFSATAAPAPGAVALFALAGMGGRRRRR